MASVITTFHPEPYFDPPTCPLFRYNPSPADKEAFREFAHGLKGQRKEAMGNPLYIGRVLSPAVQIEPIAPNPHARPIPSFALNGGPFKLRISELIRPFRGEKKESEFSQMWLADVLDMDEGMNHGQVLMKIFQQSFLPEPLRGDEVVRDGFKSALQLAGVENLGYTNCKPFQGIHLPYCFGFYEACDPSMARPASTHRHYQYPMPVLHKSPSDTQSYVGDFAAIDRSRKHVPIASYSLISALAADIFGDGLCGVKCHLKRENQ